MTRGQRTLLWLVAVVGIGTAIINALLYITQPEPTTFSTKVFIALIGGIVAAYLAMRR